MKHFAFAFAVLFLPACLESDVSKSDTKSLENFVAASGDSLVVNTCEGPYINSEYAELEYADVPEELKGEFSKALSSIPLSMREIFATQMLGKLVVSQNIAVDCQNALTNLSEERLKSDDLNTLSCLRGDPGQPGVELVIPADKASLRHSLVRGFFAAAFTTMSSTKYHPKLKYFVAATKDAELIGIERKIALALRADLEKLGSDRIRMAEIYGETIANAKSMEQATKAFDRLSADKRSAISLAVIRETADQYYCSSQTRAVMREKFITTYEAFKSLWVLPVHEMLGEKDPETLGNEPVLSLVNVDSAGDNGFALWGRWGPGNGPVRAWGASRMAARQAGGVGVFPNWNLARQQGYAAGGVGAFPNWQLSRQSARQQLRQAGLPGNSLFPNYWANRLVR